MNCFILELKRHNVSHYIYYLATDNIHIVLENDNTVLIKGLKKGCKCNSQETRIYRNCPDIIEIKRNHISATQGKSYKAGVFPDVINIHEHKRY